jgi:YebC/PmpR family DNA-binding regulatory protein
MAGHSKWANIKHRKAKADMVKGKMFTKMSKEITMAAREGGPDPTANFRLRTAIQDARAANMPNENIERAIKRGTGELEGVQYEEIVYEGYGPGGVAIMLDLISDNRNRTASDIRYIFSKYGGNLGESGCVAWMFDTKGLITIDKNVGIPEDDLLMHALEAGAEDFVSDPGEYQVITKTSDLESVKTYFEEQGIKIVSAEMSRIPKSTVEVSLEHGEQLIKLLDALDDNDDVQKIYGNYDLPPELLKDD